MELLCIHVQGNVLQSSRRIICPSILSLKKLQSWIMLFKILFRENTMRRLHQNSHFILRLLISSLKLFQLPNFAREPCNIHVILFKLVSVFNDYEKEVKSRIQSPKWIRVEILLVRQEQEIEIYFHCGKRC